MELQNFLTEALKERFKAEHIVRSIEKKIISIAREITFDKYQTVPFFENNMEFELVGVTAHFSCYDFEIRKVRLRLAYFCKSKLPVVCHPK